MILIIRRKVTGDFGGHMALFVIFSVFTPCIDKVTGIMNAGIVAVFAATRIFAPKPDAKTEYITHIFRVE